MWVKVVPVLNWLSTTPWRCRGDWTHSSTILDFSITWRCGVSSLRLRGALWIGGWLSPGDGLGRCGAEKNLFPLSGIELQSVARRYCDWTVPETKRRKYVNILFSCSLPNMTQSFSREIVTFMLMLLASSCSNKHLKSISRLARRHCSEIIRLYLFRITVRMQSPYRISKHKFWEFFGSRG
jgi:hypothetical protein